MKILVVDDSIVFRTQISSSLTDIEGIEIVGTAANGKIALKKLEELEVDLITLDMEMPEMNGLETLRALRSKGYQTKVIVFSSKTIKGAERALEALASGADDVVLKPSEGTVDFERAHAVIRDALLPKVMQFFNRSRANLAPKTDRVKRKSFNGTSMEAIVIASSTGGPAALETIFGDLRGSFSKPIFIVQHMPPVFTEILAKRLSSRSDVLFKEAVNGEKVKSGVVYIAPGDWHMQLERKGGEVFIELNQSPQRGSVRPAADNLFETASAVYGDKLCGIVLTGMGEDGAKGAKVIRENNGFVMIQNKESCVVFGMPGAVFANNDFDEMADLETIRKKLWMSVQ